MQGTSKMNLFTNTKLPDLIELKNISQSYDGGKSFIIKDCNLLIEDKHNQGQFVVILGGSGCGKSTILRYISGLQHPTNGEIILHGKAQKDEDRVGMVFQKYSSFPWLTVLENLMLPLQIRGGFSKAEMRAKAFEMLKLVGLDGQANKYAQYPTLSGGQLQRVAIARSLLANSGILLMDEPFGALDVRTRLMMQELILNIWRTLSAKNSSTTIVFVTHDISEAVYLADEIWIMGGKPAKVVERIQVQFPVERTRDLKRQEVFKNMVEMLEDKMMALAEEKK